MENSSPKIGVGVFIRKDGKILLGKRIGKHATNTWSPSGGHLEFGETPEQAAIRETLEETGLEITNIKSGPYTNDIYLDEGKHYITLMFVADWKSGEPKILEPDKWEQWDWFSLDNLPQPLMMPVQKVLDSGFDPFSI